MLGACLPGHRHGLMLFCLMHAVLSLQLGWSLCVEITRFAIQLKLIVVLRIDSFAQCMLGFVPATQCMC